MRPWLSGTSGAHETCSRADGCTVVSTVMAAIGRFAQALIGDRIRSGLERTRVFGKAVGRPRTRVTRDQVFALRSQGLSYRAAARRLHISPALAHRLAQEATTAGPSGRSETPPAHLETTPNPHACPAAFQGHHAPATGKRSNP
jgi:DNA invertase Pin-like site-specific DNA recombinase